MSLALWSVFLFNTPLASAPLTPIAEVAIRLCLRNFRRFRFLDWPDFIFIALLVSSLQPAVPGPFAGFGFSPRV
jgi:hypothetical protein